MGLYGLYRRTFFGHLVVHCFFSGDDALERVREAITQGSLARRQSMRLG